MKKYIVFASALLLVAAGVVGYGYSQSLLQPVSTVSAAAVDYFLKIDSIEGEVMDESHMGEIMIDSWSWGEAQGGIQKGRSSGKVSLQDFHFTMKTSKASPKLMLASAKGEHIPEAVLTARKSGTSQQTYMTIKLTDVVITSYQIGAGGGDVPTDQISLNFTKIEFEYKPQNQDGSTGEPVRTGYDFKKNREF